MKVYISHNFAAREFLQTQVVPVVEAAGHKVVSRWITGPVYDAKFDSVQDVEDVYACDSLILYSDNYGERPGRGKFVELGLAIAWGKRCIILFGSGDLDCVFYSLPKVRLASNLTEAISLI